ELLGHLLYAPEDDAATLGLLGGELAVGLVEQALLLLDGDAHVGQLRDLGLEECRVHDLGLDVLGEARVEDGLADDVVVGAPAGAGDVERYLAEEAGGEGSVAGRGVL